MPITGSPFDAYFFTALSSPVSLSHFISSMVFLLPGIINKSTFFNSLGLVIYSTPVESTCSNTSKSVKFEILGSLITPIFIRFLLLLSNLSVKESSSSRLSLIYGRTPATGTLPLSSSISIPGSRMVLSPLNLLTISPFTRSLSSLSSSSRVPRS